MKRIKKTTKICALLLSVFSTITLSYSIAEAGCTSDSEVISHDVKITPELPCLNVTLDGDGCTGGVTATFDNQCETEISITGHEVFEAYDVDDNLVDTVYEATLPPSKNVPEKDRIQNSDTSKVEIIDGKQETLTYTAAIGETKHEIEITYTATQTETEGGCSTTKSSRSSGLFLVLGLGFLIAGRRKK